MCDVDGQIFTALYRADPLQTPFSPLLARKIWQPTMNANVANVVKPVPLILSVDNAHCLFDCMPYQLRYIYKPLSPLDLSVRQEIFSYPGCSKSRNQFTWWSSEFRVFLIGETLQMAELAAKSSLIKNNSELNSFTDTRQPKRISDHLYVEKCMHVYLNLQAFHWASPTIPLNNARNNAMITIPG